MSLSHGFLIFALSFAANISWANTLLPEKGVLPNEESAVKVAEAILVNVYGEKVLEERPFKAKLEGEFWSVSGTFHCPQGLGCKGGVAHIDLNKNDGKVLRVIHDK